MKKVVVWGTFDLLHEAHKEFLQKAKKLGDWLAVIVIPDEAVIENKGKPPIFTQKERVNNLKKLEYVDEVFIDSLSRGLNSLIKLKPDIFAFGYDQKTKWERQLKRYLKEKGIKLKYIRIKTKTIIHSRDLRKKLCKKNSVKF
jgi:cytidyltransferase-like protein